MQNALLDSIAQELRKTAVLSEAGIDFADQDIDEVSLTSLKGRVQKTLNALEELGASYARGNRIQTGIGVAFAGLPNAGKSSLFNALLGEERSIVTEIAGTTRDVVREHLSLCSQASGQAVTFRLEDTAGLRESEDVVEKIGMERTRSAAVRADLVLLLVDPKTDFALLAQHWPALGSPSEKTLGVITKADLIPEETSRKQFLARLAPLQVRKWVFTSSRTSEGIAELSETMIQSSAHWLNRAPGEVLLTRIEHLQAVENTISHLKRSGQAQEPDLFAADLRQALIALSPLIGDTLPDDILGEIFSQFCIGK
jgi:tRNA modification GTPase